jgi:hypothetical protein
MELPVGKQPKAYVDMTLSELVITHNQMANSPIGKDCGLAPVQSFRDKATAVRRCTGAEVRIKAVSSEQRKPISDGKVSSVEKKKQKNDWGIREGTNRDRLIKAMLKEPPKTLAQLAQAVYGDATKVGAISMVLKGITVTIDKGQLPYSVVKSKAEGGTTYALKGV